MRLKLALAGAWALLPLALSTAQAATYHVSATGSDGNPGTQTQPWATIAKAAASVNPGDTVLVAPGTYAEHVTLSRSGTASAPVRFEAVGEVTMEGFRLTGNHQQVVGFRIRTLACNGDSFGIEATGTGFLIEANDIYEMPDGGIQSGAASSNGTIRGNRLERNIQAQIELHGANHLVEGNTILRALERHPQNACRNGGDDANGISFFGTGHTIRDNLVYGAEYSDPNVMTAHVDCFQTYGSWIPGEVNSNILVEDNVCSNLTYQKEGEHGNGMYIEEVDGLTVRNNLFLSYGGIGSDGDSTNIRIVNNTFASGMTLGGVADSHRGVDFYLASDTGIIVRNNIFQDFRGGPIYVGSQVTGVVHDHNLMHWTDGVNRIETWWDFQCGVNGNVCADPKLADPANLDFRIAADSAAIDAGADPASPTDDIDGTPRPQGLAYDIGAYEQPAGPVAPSAAFAQDIADGEAPLSVAFSDTSGGAPTAWSWGFGDGATSSDQHPVHTYTVPGTYAVTLTVTNDQGSASETIASAVTVREPDSSVTLLEDGFESGLAWQITDLANWYKGVPRSETHAARLRRTGAIATTISTVGYSGIRVELEWGANSLDSAAEYLTLEWHDGTGWYELARIADGSEDNALHPLSLTLPAGADHNPALELRVRLQGNGTGDYGFVDNVLVKGTASEPPALPPQADFAADVTGGPAPLTVTFADASSGATGWLWDFGDGAGASEANPVHVYSVPGTYSVSLTVANAQGSDTETRPGLVTATDPNARAQIFGTDFAAGLTGWYKEGNVTVVAGVVNLKGNNGWMNRTISTVGYDSVRVSLRLGASSYEASERLVLYWNGSGASVPLKTVQNGSPEEDGQLHTLTFDLPPAAANNPKFGLALGQWSADSSDIGLLDDILVTGIAR